METTPRPWESIWKAVIVAVAAVYAGDGLVEVRDVGAGDGVLVAFIASEPGMAERVLVEHRDDGSGHCRKCVRRQSGAAQVWPCPLRGLAELASGVTPGGSR